MARSQDVPPDDAQCLARTLACSKFGPQKHSLLRLEPIPLLMGSFQSDRAIGSEMVKSPAWDRCHDRGGCGALVWQLMALMAPRRGGNCRGSAAPDDEIRRHQHAASAAGVHAHDAIISLRTSRQCARAPQILPPTEIDVYGPPGPYQNRVGARKRQRSMHLAKGWPDQRPKTPS